MQTQVHMDTHTHYMMGTHPHSSPEVWWSGERHMCSDTTLVSLHCKLCDVIIPSHHHTITHTHTHTYTHTHTPKAASRVTLHVGGGTVLLHTPPTPTLHDCPAIHSLSIHACSLNEIYLFHHSYRDVCCCVDENHFEYQCRCRCM